jgi:hypothetical protein
MHISLRRYDPDQVLRVEAPGLLSARTTRSPLVCLNEYTAAVTACQGEGGEGLQGRVRR